MQSRRAAIPQRNGKARDGTRGATRPTQVGRALPCPPPLEIGPFAYAKPKRGSTATMIHQGESYNKSPLFFWPPADLLIPRPMR
jgi:hypothetical protein